MTQVFAVMAVFGMACLVWLAYGWLLLPGRCPVRAEVLAEGSGEGLEQTLRAIRWLRQYRPGICRGQLSQNFLKGDHTGLGPLADFAMTNLLSSFLTVPDFIAYNHLQRRTPALRLARKIWGVREVSWTIRTPEAMAECEADGCLSIFEKFIP